jgi:hypothetical protein
MRSRIRFRCLLAFAAGILCTITALAASISVSPSTAAPAVHIRVRGSGFSAGEKVALLFDDMTVASARANSSGRFIVRIAVPASAQSGNHLIHAIAPTSGFADPITINVNTNRPEFKTSPKRVETIDNMWTPVQFRWRGCMGQLDTFLPAIGIRIV